VTAATGHYRNGILLAPLTPRSFSGLLYDDVVDPAIQLTDPHRAFDRT
jgi:glycine/D-amino acid oxidase-like deaminating enzyme